MNTKINRISWKCRRGMREIDLLLREFSQATLNTLDEYSIDTFDQVLDYDDQKLFDYIFKNESLGNEIHEDFIDRYLKKFHKQGNF
jgi:antitoxin CptB